jgi:ubiquinone/menaquinone biosynthesis C-methylase UbiE
MKANNKNCACISLNKEQEKFYEERFKFLGNVRKKIVKEFSIKKGNVLEIGTGDGYFTLELAKNLSKGKITGIDIIESAIQETKINTQNLFHKNKIEIKKMNFFQNNFSSSFFDLTATFLALCDVARDANELKKTFLEINRILKPSGRVVLSEAFPEEAENEAQTLGFQVNELLGYHYFPKKEVKKTLEEAGFKLLKEKTHYTNNKQLNLNEFKKFLKEETAFSKELKIKPEPKAKEIYREFKEKIKEKGIEFDSKITVINAIKIQ